MPRTPSEVPRAGWLLTVALGYVPRLRQSREVAAVAHLAVVWPAACSPFCVLLVALRAWCGGASIIGTHRHRPSAAAATGPRPPLRPLAGPFGRAAFVAWRSSRAVAVADSRAGGVLAGLIGPPVHRRPRPALAVARPASRTAVGASMVHAPTWRRLAVGAASIGAGGWRPRCGQWALRRWGHVGRLDRSVCVI